MHKATRTKAEVKITTFVRALRDGAFLDCSPREMQVLGWLLMSGGDRHADSHAALRRASGLPERTYFWTLGRLERRGMVEICTDPRCPHVVFGDLGWRITANLCSRSLPTLAVVQSSDQGERLPIERGTERLLTQPGAAHPEEVMRTRGPDEWDDDERTAGADPHAPPRPPKKRREPRSMKPPRPPSPAQRIRAAFEMMATKEYWGVPVTANVARMATNIKWLLEHNWPEDLIIESFRYFKNVAGDYALGPANPLWETYFKEKARLLNEAKQGMIGRRPDQEHETLAEFAARNQARRRQHG